MELHNLKKTVEMYRRQLVVLMEEPVNVPRVKEVGAKLCVNGSKLRKAPAKEFQRTYLKL